MRGEDVGSEVGSEGGGGWWRVVEEGGGGVGW